MDINYHNYYCELPLVILSRLIRIVKSDTLCFQLFFSSLAALLIVNGFWFRREHLKASPLRAALKISPPHPF